MGACSSKPQPLNLNNEETIKYEEIIRKINERNNEQQNLLRFKVEVLVNMMAVEEKKNESMTKRVETLKWILLQQGVNEEMLSNVLLKSDNSTEDSMDNTKMINSIDRTIKSKSIAILDLNGSISRMREEFSMYPEEILQGFAENDGRIVTSLTFDDFMKQLYTLTENVSKSDIQILALRFGDGNGNVSVPEFLEFFATPPQIRLARAASSAVRMSFDLLQLQYDQLDENGNPIDLDDKQAVYKMLKSHKTDYLEDSIKKILLLFEFVEESLRTEFSQQESSDEPIIERDQFMKCLSQICGMDSKILQDAVKQKRMSLDSTSNQSLRTSISELNTTKKPVEKPVDKSLDKAKALPKESPTKKTSMKSGNESSEVDAPPGIASGDQPIVVYPLNEDDIHLITERFELGGFVHYGHFLNYCKEALYLINQSIQKLKVNLPIGISHIHGYDLKASKDWKAESAQFIPISKISPFRLSTEWNALRASAMMMDHSKNSSSAPSPMPLPTGSIGNGEKSNDPTITPANSVSKPAVDSSQNESNETVKTFNGPKKLPPNDKAEEKNSPPVQPVDDKEARFNKLKAEREELLKKHLIDETATAAAKQNMADSKLGAEQKGEDKQGDSKEVGVEKKDEKDPDHLKNDEPPVVVGSGGCCGKPSKSAKNPVPAGKEGEKPVDGQALPKNKNDEKKSEDDKKDVAKGPPVVGSGGCFGKRAKPLPLSDEKPASDKALAEEKGQTPFHVMKGPAESKGLSLDPTMGLDDKTSLPEIHQDDGFQTPTQFSKNKNSGSSFAPRDVNYQKMKKEGTGSGLPSREGLTLNDEVRPNYYDNEDTDVTVRVANAKTRFKKRTNFEQVQQDDEDNY